MSNFAVINQDTGEIVRAGEAPDDMISLQAGEGEIALALPPGVLAWPEINLAVFQNHLCGLIDAGAEDARQSLMTPGSGQLASYLNKAAEAKAYLVDPDSVTPYLSAEAAATGMTVAALADLVNKTAQAWMAVDVRIEAARRGAKLAVNAAKDFAAIYKAAQVNWSELIHSA